MSKKIIPGPKLLGKVIIKGIIKAETGLHIGSSQQALEIGGIDNPIIRNPMTREPYIPGSSLKGKMRSLMEIAHSKTLVVIREDMPRIHYCNDPDCEVCRIFGRPADDEKTKTEHNMLTRLSVRDAFLTPESRAELENIETGYFMSEIKWENQIDRLTSAANPRQTERVPPGAKFFFEMSYDIYDEKDVEYLEYLFEGMKLVEDSYIGGQGSRGYGKIKFHDLEITLKNRDVYLGKEAEKMLSVDGKSKFTLDAIFTNLRSKEKTIIDEVKEFIIPTTN